MKTLLLMRHAKSSWKNVDLADHDRPLNKRGLRDGPRMGAWLCRQGLAPDLVVASTARRAARTAELVSEACGLAAPPELRRELYGASAEELMAAVQAIPGRAGAVLLVAHNPGVEDLAAELCGERLRMPTAAVAVFDFETDAWKAADAARLRCCARPKELAEDS